MSILDLIKEKSEWEAFYNYKIDKGHLNKREEKELREFIDEEKYLNIALNINSEDFNFAPPVKNCILLFQRRKYDP